MTLDEISANKTMVFNCNDSRHHGQPMPCHPQPHPEPNQPDTSIVKSPKSAERTGVVRMTEFEHKSTR